MDEHGNVRDDMKLPEETDDDKVVSKRITEGLDELKDIFCTVLAAMNIEKVVDAKEKDV